MATTVNPTGAPILPGQNLDNPTNSPVVPTTVPTTAPVGGKSVSQAPAIPTAVVSSQPAIDNVEKINGKLNLATQNISNQQDDKVANQGKPGYDVFGNPVSGTPLPGGGADQTKPQTAEEKIMSQPDDGNTHIYDSQGNQHQIPIDQPIPQGYSKINPTIGPTGTVTATAQAGNIMYKQFQDGTYGRYNVNDGSYNGMATSDDFKNTQQSQTDKAKLDSINNGTYPLSSSEQAIIQGIKDTYAKNEAIQQTINANIAGVTSIQQSMFGIANTSMGQGAISKAISDGADKITALNNEMLSKVAEMTQAMEDKDYIRLKQSYDDFSAKEQNRTSEIKSLQDATAKAQKDINAQLDQQTMDNAIGTQLTSGVTDPVAIESALTKQGIKTSASDIADTLSKLTPNAKALTDLMKTASSNGAPDSIKKAIGSAKTLNDAYVAAGAYGDGGTGIIASYNLSKANGYTGSLNDFTQAHYQAQSQGTTQGKLNVANANTVDSSFGTITIPQDAGNQKNQLAFQNNNPGNLRLAGQPGATQGTGGFAKFATPEEGYKALINDITSKITKNPDTTLVNMMNIYAPKSDNNDPDKYAAFIAKQLGVSSDTKLSQLDPSKVAAQIAQYESGTTITPGWNTNDSSPPPSGEAGNVPFGITGKTPNYIYQSALTLALDKAAKPQQFAGGLSGKDPKAVAIKDAVSNKMAALVTGAGVNQPVLQQQFHANAVAINKQISYLNDTERAVGNAEKGVNQALQFFANKGINPNDSTWANTKLNDLSKQLGDSGDIRAYQAALTEVGNEYSQVFSRGGQRNEKADARAQDVINGNITLSDLQKVTDELQAQGKIVIDGSINQVKSISSGGGADEVAKFLAYVYNKPDSATQQVIQDDKQNKSSVISFVGTDPEKQKIVSQFLSRKNADGTNRNYADAVTYLRATGKIK